MPLENPNENTSDEIEVVVEQPAEADSGGTADAGGTTPDNQESAPPRSEQPAGERDEELEQYSENVRKRISKLTGRLREAERREQAAIEYARSLKTESDQVQQNLAQLSNAHLYEYGERLKAQEVLLNNTLTNAINTGNTQSQIEAQKALAELALDQRRYQQMVGQRQNAAAQRQQPVQQPVQQPQQVVQNQAPPDPKAESWAQRNEWFGKDEAMTLTAFSIHKKLVEQEGIDPTSDEYYREIDQRMRREFPHKFQRERASAAPTTVAPAVRTVQQGTKQTTQVRLTPSQVAIAKKLGVPLEQYARQVAKLNSREG